MLFLLGSVHFGRPTNPPGEIGDPQSSAGTTVSFPSTGDPQSRAVVLLCDKQRDAQMVVRFREAFEGTMCTVVEGGEEYMFVAGCFRS